MRTSIAFTVAALAALSPLVTSADESASFWESISENSNYAEVNTVETPRIIQIEKSTGWLNPMRQKTLKQERSMDLYPNWPRWLSSSRSGSQGRY